jgi:serine/threonine protein kinase
VAIEVHGLVHRDLKPANLMLVEGPELTIKVIDFGLAKAALEMRPTLLVGGVVGTPCFASPEQFDDTSVTSVQIYIRWVAGFWLVLLQTGHAWGDFVRG